MSATPGTEEVKSKRELMKARLEKKYPDKTYEDDEAFFGQIYDDYVGYDDELTGYREQSQRLTELFNANPAAARFITDMAKGEDPWIAVIKRMGIDGVSDLLNDPEKQEAYAEANKEYIERVANEKNLEQEYQANLDASLDMIEAYKAEHGYSDDEIDAATALIGKMARDYIMGKFTKDSLDMVMKALNHESDIALAEQKGEVRGRNARVEEKLRKPTQGDGMPVLGASNNVPTRSRRSIFDDAREAM